MESNNKKALTNLRNKFGDLLKNEAVQADVKSGASSNDVTFKPQDQTMNVESTNSPRKELLESQNTDSQNLPTVYMERLSKIQKSEYDDQANEMLGRQLHWQDLKSAKNRLPYDGLEGPRLAKQLRQLYIGLYGGDPAYDKKWKGKVTGPILNWMCSLELYYIALARQMLREICNRRSYPDDDKNYLLAGSVVRSKILDQGWIRPEDLPVAEKPVSKGAWRNQIQLGIFK